MLGLYGGVFDSGLGVRNPSPKLKLPQTQWPRALKHLHAFAHRLETMVELFLYLYRQYTHGRLNILCGELRKHAGGCRHNVAHTFG